MAGNTNNVFIIIQAVDKATKPVKKIETGMEKLGKSIKTAGKTVGDFAKLAGAVAGGFTLAYNVLSMFGDKARDLGFTEAANQVDLMKQSLADSEAAILKFNLGGREIQEWLGRAAEGFGTVTRLAGVLASVLVGNLQKQINNTRLAFWDFTNTLAHAGSELGAFLGIITQEQNALNQATSVVGTYTQAMAIADNAIVDLTMHTNVANFATVGLAKSMATKTKAIKAQTKATKDLNSEFNKLWARSEAIRSGDALALMGLSGGGGAGAKGGGGTRGTGPASGRNMGGAAKTGDNITVIIGGEVVDGRVRKVIRDEVIKPVVKKTGVRGK